MDKRIEVLKKIKCFILDMDGTIYLGGKLIRGADEFIRCLAPFGIDHYFYTNNSSKNVPVYEEKLRKMGVPNGDGKVLISNAVILRFLKQNMPDARVFLLGTPYLREDFEKAGVTLVEDDPTVVVVGFDTTLAYDRLSKACTFIREGVPVYGVNPDLNCPVENGFIPDCGSIFALITASTGVEPIEYFGKPSRRTLEYVLDVTGYKEEEVAFVGDRLYTDMAVAKGTKAQSLLVLSGESTVDDIPNYGVEPTAIFSSVDEIRKLLCEIYK